MSISITTIFKRVTHSRPRGFILPFTMLIVTLVLMVSSGAMTLLSKQLYFSRVYKQSQAAYYAADDAMACALVIDDTYVGTDGLGIFPSGTSTDAMSYINDTLAYVNSLRAVEVPAPTPLAISLSDIRCGQMPVFVVASSSFATSSDYYSHYSITNGQEFGVSSSFNMRMPIGDGTFRCAKVTVNKTDSFRQIISQGYAKCDTANGAVERAVVNTSISE